MKRDTAATENLLGGKSPTRVVVGNGESVAEGTGKCKYLWHVGSPPVEMEHLDRHPGRAYSFFTIPDTRRRSPFPFDTVHKIPLTPFFKGGTHLPTGLVFLSFFPSFSFFSSLLFYPSLWQREAGRDFISFTPPFSKGRLGGSILSAFPLPLAKGGWEGFYIRKRKAKTDIQVPCILRYVAGLLSENRLINQATTSSE